MNDANDPRRVNQLFMNLGDGSFREEAALRGLDLGTQSWSLAFGDIDNDGDFDGLVTNHDAPTSLHLNDGKGFFTDITDEAGLSVSGVPIQSWFADFDNDGYLDILILGSEEHLYRNNQNQTFELQSSPFGFYPMVSGALGDLNNDGTLDLLGTHPLIINTPSSISDRCWIGVKNENNHLKVTAIGSESNQSAIGVNVKIFGDWGIQSREIRSGESYGIMNSTTQHFGLSTSLSVDSMHIRWPSGVIDRYFDLEVNGHLVVQEGRCVTNVFDLVLDGSNTFCDGESVVASSITGSSYLWRSGDTSKEILVSDSREEQVVMRDQDNCQHFSKPISFQLDPPVSATLNYESKTICHGDSLKIDIKPSQIGTWSTGEMDSTIMVNSSGKVFATIRGLCRDFYTDTLIVQVANEPQFKQGDIYPLGLDAKLVVRADTVLWYEDSLLLPIFVGDTLVVAGRVTDTVLTYYYSSTEEIIGDTFVGGLPIDRIGKDRNHQKNIAGLLFFDVEQGIRLDSFAVGTDTAGIREFELTNGQGKIIATKMISLDSGINWVHVNWLIPQGLNYSIGTNVGVNLANFNTVSPQLWRSSENISYPIAVNDIVIIRTSNLGQQSYFYFYDWHIKIPNQLCQSTLNSFNIIFSNSTTSSIQVSSSPFTIFPNPTKGIVQIESNSSQLLPTMVFLRDMNGQILTNFEVNNDASWQLNLTHIPNGSYILSIHSKWDISHQLIFKL